jgi:uncharacterized Zn-binding protein involved in type VI secretion
MAAIARQGDSNGVGGTIMRGASTVFANGIPVGLHVSQITSHAPWGKPHKPHDKAVTTSGSSVMAEGSQVLKVGSGTSCGHNIAEGSPDVNVP